MKRFLSLLTVIAIVGISNVWGAPDHSYNESWNFTTSGNSNWTSSNCGSYCGAWGKNKNGSPVVYKSNISNFSDIDFSKHENVSVTIYVTAATNGGTNSYTVKLINSQGNQVSTYTSTKTNGMGNYSSSASDAEESYVTFSPTQAFSGYRIEFNPKSFITNTRYVLTYDDKQAASCDKSLSLTKSVSGNGSFNVYQGSVSDGNMIAFTNNAASIDNCGSGTTTLVVVPQASEHYHISSVEATNKKAQTSITESNGQYSIQYAQGSNVTSQITVTFAEDDHSSIVLNDANGDGDAITNKYVGENYTLPTSAATCTGKTFVGWSTVTVSKTNTKPTSNFYEPGATYENLPASIKFYAVYAKVSGTIDTYKKISQTSELTNGLSVIIMNGTKALENDDWLYDATPTIENGLITSDASGIIWTYNTISGGFTLKNTSGKYLKAQNVKNEYITLAEASYTWTFSEEADFVLKGSDNRYLEYYSSAFTSYGSYSSNNASCYQMDIYIPNWSLSAYATGCEACAVDPTIGTAGLKSAGAYGLDGVEVSVSGMYTGSDACEWTDYGFYWGTSANKKANKKQVGTSGSATSFEATLAFEAPEQFAAGTTYYFRAYGKNSKSGAAIAYGTEASFTPQSVTFNMNGHGSQVATQYVNNGGTATDPGTTSITGYTFNGWKLNSSAYSFSTPVTGNITLVADWSIKSHTITWTTDGDALTGDYTGKSGKVNYSTTIVAPNTPTKTGYTFAAWSPTPAATMPDHDLSYTATWTAKQYAITLDREGATTGSESVTMTYDANTHTAITAPSKDGYIFGGWYAEDNGTGAQVMNASGTLQANVEGFTGANGIWTKDATCTLYAKWTPITFTVAYNANGGSGETMSNQDYTYDVPQTLSANTYTAPLHKYFYGWHSVKASADAGSREFTDGQTNVQNLTKTNGATVTLYAVWKDHTYTNYRTLCCNPLAAPANIEVSVTGAATATVTWNPVAEATGYEYKLGDGDWTDTEIAGNAVNPELSLSGLTGATDYTIYVRTNGSGDNCAEGTASAGTGFKTHSTVTAAVNDALMGTAKVKLSDGDWSTSVEAADGTTIYLQATPGSLYQFNGWSDPASGTISEGQLTGWSGDVTVTANFVAKQLTKLDTPTGMGLVGEPGATSATIKWNVVDHASSYQVVCEGATIGDVTITDGVASCPLTLLTVNTTYNWTVKAKGDDVSFEDGDACASQSFKTDLKKPTAIEITHEPTVTEYLEGESFATAGMVVKVTYNNGDIDGAYSTYTIDPSGALEYGTTSVTVTASLNEVSVSTTQAITVHKKYTLTFKNNGSIVETKNLKEGDAYGTFPSAGVSCDNAEDGSKTFMGWSTAEINEKQADAPTEGYASTTDVMGTKNVVLNAVWAKLDGAEGYQLVTAPSAGKTYIFVASNAAGSAYALHAKEMNTSQSQNATSPAKAVTVSSGTPVYVETEDEELEFVFADSKYSIVSREGYYFFINGYGVSRRTSAQGTWDDDNGLYATSTSGKTTYYLSLDNSDPEDVKFYFATSSENTNRVYAYEKQEASYTNYITTCCEDWSVTASYGEGNVISVSDGAVAVTVKGDTYGTASYESDNTAVLTVAADGKITGVKAGSATVTIAWAGIPGSKCAFETTVDVTVNGPISVTYNANDGSETPATKTHSGTISSNSAFALEANTFNRTGYTFQGWATTPSGEKAYNNSQADVEFAENTVLYAVWAINSHAVTLTQPDGNEIQATGAANLASVAYGTSITLSAEENDGYVFTGWDAEGVVLANTNPVAFTMPDNDVTVTATYSTYTWDLVNYTVAPTPGTVYTDADQFDKSAYTVTGNYERSDTKTPKAVDLAANAWTVKLNGTAIADDYEFAAGDDGKELAFYVDETMVWSDDITVTEVDKDRFIDGLWGETFTLKKGTYDMPTPQAHAAGSTDCQKHNTFAGWVLEANAENPTVDDLITGEAATGVTAANNTYYAVWSKSENIKKEFTVSKTSFGSSETGSSSSVSIGTDIRYSTAQNGGTNGPTILTSNYHLKLYRPHFANSQVYGNSITFTAATDMTLKKVELDISEGDYFKYIESTYTTTGLSDGAASDGKIILDNLNERNLTIINTTTSDTKKAIEISKIEVTYEKEVTEIDYITDCDPRYDVEFSAGIGATGSYDKVTKKAGVEITLPDGSALSKDHHKFAGWYSAYYDVTYSATNEWKYIVPAGGETLVAQWTEDHHAFVTFKNGENIIGEPLKVYDGGIFDLLGAQEADGKAFIGWKWNGSIYTAGQQNQHMPATAEDRTYTAVWMSVIDVATADAADLSDGKWILVEKKSQLKAGDFIVIAAAGYNAALSNYQKTSNRGDATVTKNIDTLTHTSSVAPLFLQYDPENDYYAFYDRAYTTDPNVAPSQKGYLYAPNALKTQSNITMQGVWAIDIADKKASIVAQGNNSDKIMRYNKGSNLFNCYGTATQSDIAIYKWAKNISSDMNVSDISNTDMVIVPNGKTLTIDEAATLDNVVVEVGGKVNNTNNLTVNSLTIKSEAGKSGQVADGNKISANAVYMNVTFFKGAAKLNAETADRWYMISAPFDVNLSNGFFQVDGTPMVFGTDFDLFEYDGNKRATTGTTGWKRAQGKMNAGVACLIGFNENQPTTIRLKAASAVGEPESIELKAFTGDSYNQNWNGVANPTLHYTNISHDVQTYNNEDDKVSDKGRKYLPYSASSTSFVVGTAFFVQATGQIDLSAATNGSLRAPKRESERYEACVQIFRQEATEFADQMYVRASETASSEYEQGHDMITWNDATGNTAMLWAENYGKRLAIEEAPLVNDKASYELGIFAPAEGTYRIEANDSHEDATLYLTYNDRAIWNLSMSACEVELTKGLNEGYGLKLVVKAPQTPTGVEDVQMNDVQCMKMIIDEKVFILRGGKMYDVTGKAVR